ncbi:unnamed protein product [Clonostachys rosea]|uniref:Ankyrin n=1 Tax=Bionectria ochroleuca TaxID=29856 RepID=A0ABY6U5S0_BIOOC|nr:unnamed protein product [Clonostachys rosea]
MQTFYDRAYLGAFEILLEAGADVYSPCPLFDANLASSHQCRKYSKLLEDMETPKEWYPTCLDWGFQRDKQLFDLMLLRNSSDDGTMTRHGVLRAAIHGKLALCAYVRSRDSLSDGQAKNFLELVMREQLSKFGQWGFFNISVLKTLIDAGVQIHQSDRPECCSRLLQDAREGIDNETYQRLNHFIHYYSCVSPEAISEAVSEKGTTLLELLPQFGIEAGKIGGHALLRAARIGNFDAVNWLLCAGVNINEEVYDDSRPRGSFTIVALLIREINSHENIGMKISMLQYLINRGAELKERTEDQYAGGLFEHVLVRITETTRDYPTIEGPGINREEMLHSVEYEDKKTANFLVPWLFDQLGVGSRKIAGPELQALFAAALVPKEGLPVGENLRHVINGLYTSYGLPPRPEAILASLIERRAGNELIKEAIQKSAVIDMYTEAAYYDLWLTPLQAAAYVCSYPSVLQLLDRGADVNAPPRGLRGVTALQAICHWSPISGEDRDHQQKIVNLLIKNGANINAGISDRGMTAIMYSACEGDVELAAVLLAHGADPNLHVKTTMKGQRRSTLDAATDRCDMVKLLLDAGALSGQRGSTGYEGAVLDAEKYGNHASARILRDHIKRQERQFRVSPELWACHNAVMDKMDKQDAERREKTLSSRD